MAFRSKSNWDYSGFADWKERELTSEELADDENYRKAMDKAVRQSPMARHIIDGLNAAANKAVEAQRIFDRDRELGQFKAFQECPRCTVMDWHWIGEIIYSYHWRICRNCKHKWKQK